MNVRVSSTSRMLQRNLLYFVAILAIFFAVPQALAKITKGPVLLRVYNDKACLMWETDVNGSSKVLYGEGEKLEKQVSSIPLPIEYSEKENQKRFQKTAFVHKTWLDGLKQGQVYNYQVDGGDLKSETYHFRTPSSDANEVKFIVYGDSRSNPDAHLQLVKLMIEKKVDFVVHSGDLVYTGDDYTLWGPQLFEPLKGLAECVPVYILKGNHEIGSKNYYEKLLIPPDEKNNFSFSYGPVHYCCIDQYSTDDNDRLIDFIKSDMNNSTSLWKFVTYHEPSINFGGHWSMWESPRIFGILSAARVDFAVAGHSHQYERFYPMSPPMGVNGNYVTYITAGGGGASLDEPVCSIFQAKTKETHHFCLFHIKGKNLTLDTIDVKGQTIDHLEIAKTDNKLNSEYIQSAIMPEAVCLYQNLYCALDVPVTPKPEKDKPFTLHYKLSLPALSKPTKITFKLDSNESEYKLPEPKTVLMPKEGGTVTADLTIVPLIRVGIHWKSMILLPRLQVVCIYEMGDIHGEINRQIIYDTNNENKK